MAGTITWRYTVSVTWVDLWPTVSLISCSGTPLLLMIDTAVCRPSWACQPVVLPEPLAGLVLRLTAVRHGHASTGDQGTSPWLLPGGRPGQPISPYRVSERLRQIGIRPGPAHSTALFQLATELPAAILARMLGIHIDVAVAWQRASRTSELKPRIMSSVTALARPRPGPSRHRRHNRRIGIIALDTAAVAALRGPAQTSPLSGEAGLSAANDG